MAKSLALQLLVVVALICNLSVTDAFTSFLAANKRVSSPMSMVARSANKRSSSNKPPSRPAGPERISTPKPQQQVVPRLGQREGARPLSKAELKAKDIYEASKGPEVARLYALEDRKPLSDFQKGQKLRGRIISVKDFGLFVDIGAKRDGLIHVKDISKDYFIQNHQQKFIPGQDVDVWIKFVEDENFKLGLQMFPPIERLAAREGVEPVALANLETGDEVSGIVVRVSNYGVYVDIGAEVDVFLHVRKMKITRRQRSMKPWEVMPVGSKVENAFVLEVDATRKRCALTTYSPEQWDDMLPMKTEAGGEMVDDEEELGGSTVAANYRALERTLGLTTDDDDDDEDGFDADEGEELTVAEIEALAESRTRRAQVLIDDVGGGNEEEEGGDVEDVMAERRRSGASTADEGEEISVDELFQEICGRGRDYITVKDLKKWDYLQDLITDGDIDEESLAELAREAGAVQGKMQVDEFDAFIELLADTLGLEDDDGTYEDDDEEDSRDAGKGGRRSTSSRDDGNKSEEDDEDDDGLIVIDDFNDDGILSFSVAPSASASTKATTAAAAATGKKAASDVVATKNKVQQAVEEEEEDEDELQDISLMGSRDDAEDPDFGLGFGGTVLGTGPFATGGTTSSGGKGSGDDGSSPLADMYEKKTRTNDILNYVFGSVAGKKGYAELKDVLSWDFTRSLLTQGAFTEQSIKNLFEKCKPTNGGRLSKDGFERLVELMSEPEVTGEITKKNAVSATTAGTAAAAVAGEPAVTKKAAGSVSSVTTTAAAASRAKGSRTREEEEVREDKYVTIENAFKELSRGKKTVTLEEISEWDVIVDMVDNEMTNKRTIAVLFKEAGGKIVTRGGGGKGKAATSAIDFEGFKKFIELQDIDFGHDEDGELGATEDEKYDDDDYDVDEEDDESIYVDDAFEELAGGKETATFEAISEWDIVDDMLDDGLISKEDLSGLFKQAGGKTIKKGGKATLVINLEGFHAFLDLLAPLAGDDEEDSSFSLSFEDAVTTDESSATAAADDDDVLVKRYEDDDDISDEELTKSVFVDLANGKKFVSVKDMLSWDIVLKMMGEGLLTDELLCEMFVKCPGYNGKGVRLEGFAQIVDELVGLYGDNDDDEDEAGEAGDDVEDDDDDEEEFIEIDVEEAFDEVAKGKDYITFKELQEWELIAQLKADGDFDENALRELIEKVGIEDPNNIDIIDFEAIIDELSDGDGDDEDDEEEEEE